MDTPEDRPPETVPEPEIQPEIPPELFQREVPPARQPWKLRDLALLSVFALFALVLSTFITYAGYAVLRPFFGWPAQLDLLHVNAFFILAGQVLFYVLLMGCVYFLVAVYYRLPFWQGLGWRPLPTRRALHFAVLGALLSFGIEFAPTLLPDKNRFPLVQLFNSPAAAYALGLFAILIAPPIEELLFRGVLFAFFERLGLWFAIAATAVLFAALHVQEYAGAWNHALLILVVGLVFSLARGMTGSLAPSVVLHMSYNATQMVVLFFASHHFRSMPGLMW